MNFKMFFEYDNEIIFHEWNTLKADLVHRYHYTKDDLYRVLESLIDNGVYYDMSSYMKGAVDFISIRTCDDQEIRDPAYFCGTWLVTPAETYASYETFREAVDFARHNHEFLIKSATGIEGDETLHSSYDDHEIEQYIEDKNGKTVFIIYFNGEEKTL